MCVCECTIQQYDNIQYSVYNSYYNNDIFYIWKVWYLLPLEYHERLHQYIHGFGGKVKCVINICTLIM